MQVIVSISYFSLEHFFQRMCYDRTFYFLLILFINTLVSCSQKSKDSPDLERTDKKKLVLPWFFDRSFKALVVIIDFCLSWIWREMQLQEGKRQTVFCLTVVRFHFIFSHVIGYVILHDRIVLYQVLTVALSSRSFFSFLYFSKGCYFMKGLDRLAFAKN